MLGCDVTAKIMHYNASWFLSLKLWKLARLCQKSMTLEERVRFSSKNFRYYSSQKFDLSLDIPSWTSLMMECGNSKPTKDILLTYLLTYLFDHYNLLQVLASANLRRHTSRAVAAWRQFRIPAFLDSHQTVWPNAGKAVLVCDIHHLDQIRRLYKLDWSYPYERHDPAIKDAVL